MERSVWGNQWRGTGLPGSLTTKLINFSKVGREMEEEAHSWGFLSQQQLVGPPGHSLGYGAQSASHSAHMRPATPPGPQRCTPVRTGQDWTAHRRLAWGYWTPPQMLTGHDSLQTHLCLTNGGSRPILADTGRQRPIPADTWGPSGGPREPRAAASCRALVLTGKSSQNKMQLPSLTTNEAGPRLSPENQGARHARWPGSHLRAPLYPLTVTPLPSKQMVMIQPLRRERSRRL